MTKCFQVTDDETIAARKLDASRKDLEAKHGPLPDDAKIQQVNPSASHIRYSLSLVTFTSHIR